MSSSERVRRTAGVGGGKADHPFLYRHQRIGGKPADMALAKYRAGRDVGRLRLFDHDGASEEHAICAELRSSCRSANETREQRDSVVELALFLERLGDAVFRLQNLWRPRIQGLELLEKFAGLGCLTLLLDDASASEEGDRLSLLNEL